MGGKKYEKGVQRRGRYSVKREIEREGRECVAGRVVKSCKGELPNKGASWMKYIFEKRHMCCLPASSSH